MSLTALPKFDPGVMAAGAIRYFDLAHVVRPCPWGGGDGLGLMVCRLHDLILPCPPPPPATHPPPATRPGRKKSLHRACALQL
jgi:hypothetical protein